MPLAYLILCFYLPLFYMLQKSRKLNIARWGKLNIRTFTYRLFHPTRQFSNSIAPVNRLLTSEVMYTVKSVKYMTIDDNQYVFVRTFIYIVKSRSSIICQKT